MALIAPRHPAPVWAARGEYVPLIPNQTPRGLREWLDHQRVTVLYIEDPVRDREPSVWPLIESLVGTSLTVVFADGPIRSLAVNASGVRDAQGDTFRSLDNCEVCRR